MQEKRKRGRPRIEKEDEEEYKIIGMRHWHVLARDRKEKMAALLEAKIHNAVLCWVVVSNNNNSNNNNNNNLLHLGRYPVAVNYYYYTIWMSLVTGLFFPVLLLNQR